MVGFTSLRRRRRPECARRWVMHVGRESKVLSHRAMRLRCGRGVVRSYYYYNIVRPINYTDVYACVILSRVSCNIPREIRLVFGLICHRRRRRIITGVCARGGEV